MAPPPSGHVDRKPMLHRLRLAHAYGIYPAGFHDAIIAHGDDAFIFCVGRHIAICDHVRKRVVFLQRDARNRIITAAARAPNGRWMAIAEKQDIEEGTSQISIWNLPRSDGGPAGGAADPAGTRGDGKQDALRVLTPSNRRIDIIGLAFTGDGKHLVSLSGMPDSTITYWRWEIDKAVAQHDLKLTVCQLLLNPKNGCMLSISGPKYLRIWEYNTINHTLQESPSLFPLKEEKQLNIIAHCWVLSAFLVAATDDGHVHLFEEGEQGPEHRAHVDVRAIIARDEASGQKAMEREQAKHLHSLGMLARPHTEPAPVTLQALASWSRGFAVGGDGGYLGVFKVDGRCQVEAFGTFRIPGDSATIWQMCAGSDDMNLTILSFTDRDVRDETGAAPLTARSSRRPAYSRASTTTTSVEATSTLVSENVPSKKERVWSLCNFPVGQADLAATGQLEVFTPVFPLGIHHGPVSSVSCAGYRRCVATTGHDMQLRLWGYPSVDQQEQPGAFSSEISFAVSTYEKPQACALHPLGFQVAVILEDLLRVYHLTTQQMIRTLFDLPLKYPSDVCYSHSGNMLAVADGKDVLLLDPWRTSLIHMFSGHGGHLSNVNQVLFSDDDQTLLSCGSYPHGAIYGWAVETETKEKAFEHVSKGAHYTCFKHDLRSNLVIACTKPEGNLRVIGHLGNPFFEIVADPGSAYTSVHLSVPLEALFAGTKQGSIRVFHWPLGEGHGNNPFAEFSLHAHSITALDLSYDQRLLFSACEGGAVMACEIVPVQQDDGFINSDEHLHGKYITYRHRLDGPQKKKTNKDDVRKIQDIQKKLSAGGQVVSATTASMDEMVMVPRYYLNDRLAEIRDLEERMRNLQNEHEYALEQKDHECQEKLYHIAAERKNDRKAAAEKYDALFQQHTKAVSRHDEEMRAANEMFAKRNQGQSTEFDDRLSKEYAKESRLLGELQALREQHEIQLREVQQRHEEQLTDLRTTQEKAMREWRTAYDKVCNLLKTDGLKFEEALTEQEQEYEQEIKEMLEHKRIALQVESEKSTTALKDGVSMKQTISMLQKQRKEKDEELAKAAAEIQELQKKLIQTKDDFNKVQEQLRERERGLRIKDESLQRLREQMKHLESFRFVLFHKVRTLELERDPLEEQVSQLKANVGDMYTEFVREFRQKQQLDQQHTDKKEMAKALQSENVKLRSQMSQLKRDGRRLLQEIQQVLHTDSTDRFEKMPKMLAAVLEKHEGLAQWEAPKDETKESSVDPFSDLAKESSIIEEMIIQRDLLFRKNQIATGAASQAKRECAQEVRRLTSQNAELISEMNTLRTERKSWQRHCKELQANIMALNAEAVAKQREAAAAGRQAQKSSEAVVAHSASAPDLDSTQANRQARQARASAGETPYVRRKVVDQQEVYRRQNKKGMSQLPPVSQYMSGPASGKGAKRSIQDARFSQESWQSQASWERQGFDMSGLSDTAQAMAGVPSRRAGAALPLERVPVALATVEEPGEPGSFENISQEAVSVTSD